MLKQILNLDGAQELGKKEQKEISGGKTAPIDVNMCGCLDWGELQDGDSGSDHSFRIPCSELSGICRQACGCL